MLSFANQSDRQLVELRFVTTLVPFTAAARTQGVSVGAVPDGAKYEFFGLSGTCIKIRFLSFRRFPYCVKLGLSKYFRPIPYQPPIDNFTAFLFDL